MASSRSLFREHWRCPYGQSNSQALYSRAKDSLDVLQRLKIETQLEVHNGCVNTICWNEAGTWVLSGSDDQRLVITDPFTVSGTLPVAVIQSGHFANIFSARFMPNTQDNHVVSCSGDGMIQFTVVDRSDQHGQHPFDCHFGTTYELVMVPQDCHTFLSCGEDGTVRWFDLRIKDKCLKDECKEDILINCRRAVTALAINPLRPYQLSVGCSDSTVRIFDRRLLGTRATGNYTGRSSVTGMVSRFTAPLLEGHSHRITSLSYSTDGTELLASFSSEQIYLFNLNEDGQKEFTTNVTTTPYERRDAATAEVPSSSTSTRNPPIKRLRLRGDWSDTGPNARPERERGSGPAEQEAGTEGEQAPEGEGAAAPPAAPVAAPEGEARSVTIMQRMSDMLTRWLEGATRQADQQRTDNQQQGTSDDATPATNDDQPADAPAEPEGDSTAARTESADGSGEEGEAVSGPSDRGTAETVSDDTNTGARSEGEEESKQPPSKDNTGDTVKAGASESDKNAQDSMQKDGKTEISEKTVENRSDSDVPDVQEESARGSTESTCDEGIASQSESVIETDSQGGLAALCQGLSVTGGSSDTQSNASGGGSERDRRSPSSTSSVGSSHTPVTSQTVPLSHTASTSHTGPSSHGAGVEPLVSLRYTPEGTSSGTIRVDFPHSGTEAGPNLPPDVHRYSNRGKVSDRNSGSKVTPSTSRSTSEERGAEGGKSVDVQKGSCSSAETAVSVSPNVGEQETDTASHPYTNNTGPPAETVQEGTTAKTDCTTQSKDEKNEVGSSDTKTGDITPSGQVENSEDDETLLAPDRPDSSHVMKYCPSDESSDPSPTPADAAEAMFSEWVGQGMLEGGTGGSSVGQGAESNDPAGGGQAKSTGPHGGQEDTNAHPAEDEPAESTDPPGGGQDMPQRLASANRGASEGNTPHAAAAGGNSGRQRRHGHSGPPTGDFQLHSPPRDDSDEELASAAERRDRDDRDDIERNLAALRLQELYRKRQDEREREEQQLLNIHQPALKHVYSGHRNARTMIKEATFWGEHFVMSGSDCGHIFVWDRYTSELVMVLEGDRHVVNCLQPHPFDPVLASSGIDYDIKLWFPTAENPRFDREKAEEVVSRNRVMLEETRDTITVPASFMLRMLASLNHIRSGRRAGDTNASSSTSSDDE